MSKKLRHDDVEIAKGDCNQNVEICLHSMKLVIIVGI